MRGKYRVIPLALGLLLAAMPIQAALAQNAGEDMIVQRILAVFPGSGDPISSMRADGFGWGEIVIVLELAKLGNTTVDDIRGRFASGEGFGQIARDLNINPAELGQAVANVMSEGRSQAGGPPESAGSAGSDHSRGRR